MRHEPTSTMTADHSSSLPRIQLGSTGLSITPLCVGCSSLGNMPETYGFSVPEEQAMATVRLAFRSPINFIDTAASYGDGESERRIGLVLKELGGVPPGYVLSTKADRDLHTGDFSGDQMRRSVERSLRLLGVDRIALLFLHDPEHTTFEAAMAPDGPVAVLQRLKDEGMIEHLGVAGGPIALMARFVETRAFEAVITHNRYTLLNRSAEPLLDLAARRGIPLLNAAPYGSGILARGAEAYPRYAYQEAPSDLLSRARGTAEVCRRYGVPLAAAALQFSMKERRIACTIVGVSSPEQIPETLALADFPLPSAMWAELEPFAVAEDDPEASRWRAGRR